MATNPKPLPSVVHAVFCSGIDQASVNRIFAGFTRATSENVKEIHLLFQSVGGSVGDGIALYNFFRALPIDLTIYNAGQISSIALVAYLGAKHRRTSASATFMTHKTTSPAIALEGGKLKAMTESVALDDQRTEAILRKHITMPDERWAEIENNLWFSPEDAIKFGVAEEIADFAPPIGTVVYNI